VGDRVAIEYLHKREARPVEAVLMKRSESRASLNALAQTELRVERRMC
jgi:hypothetical protein